MLSCFVSCRCCMYVCKSTLVNCVAARLFLGERCCVGESAVLPAPVSVLHLFLASVFGAKMVGRRWPDLFCFPADGGIGIIHIHCLGACRWRNHPDTEEEEACGCKGSSLRSYGKGANIRQRHTNSASRKDDMFVPEETLTEWLYGCVVVICH